MEPSSNCVNYFPNNYWTDELSLCSHEFDHNIVAAVNFFDKTNPAKCAVRINVRFFTKYLIAVNFMQIAT